MVFAVVFSAVLLAEGANTLSFPIMRTLGKYNGINTNEKVVALTYDDGPHPVFTPQILNILDQLGVKATFFMIGKRMGMYPKVAREVVRRGHAVGNHTYTHPADMRRLTESQMEEEIDFNARLSYNMLGVRPMMFRPPRGSSNGTLLNVLKRRNTRLVLWSVSADHSDAPTPELMTRRVTDRIRPGSIILMHDGRIPGRWKDVEATRLIIIALKKQGYRFLTVPELFKLER